MGSLMPEVRHINAGSLFAQIVEEGETWLQHWIAPRMSHLLDKAVDDLLGRDRYERRANHGEASRRVSLDTAGTPTDIAIVVTAPNGISLQYEVSVNRK